MTQPLQLPVLINQISSKVDGSVKVVLETRELNSDHAAKLFGLRGKEAWAVLAAQELSEADIPTAPVDTELQTKTTSQRLRSRLFVYYSKALNGSPGEFNAWYDRYVDNWGQKHLDKIPQEGDI